MIVVKLLDVLRRHEDERRKAEALKLERIPRMAEGMVNGVQVQVLMRFYPAHPGEFEASPHWDFRMVFDGEMIYLGNRFTHRKAVKFFEELIRDNDLVEHVHRPVTVVRTEGYVEVCEECKGQL